MTLTQRALALVLLTTLLSGCGVFNTFGTDNTPPPKALPIAVKAFSAKILWQKNVGDGSDGVFLRLAPALNNGVIYSVDMDANVMATTVTGKSVFSTKLKSNGNSGVGVNADYVAIVDGRAELFMLSAKSGKVLWHLPVHNQVLAAPTVTDTVTYIKTIDGTVAAYRNTDGAVLWTYNHGGPALVLRMNSAVVVEGDTLYAAFADGEVVALDAHSGNLLWEQIIATANGFADIERMVDIDAKLIVNNGVLFAASYQGEIAALNVHSGDILWHQPISAYSGLALVNNLVIVPEADGTLKAFNRVQGNLVWQQKNLSWRFLSGPTVWNQSLLMGDIEGYIHVVDAKSGNYQGRIQPSKNPIYSAPLVDNGQVYSVDSNGQLTAIAIS